MSLNVWILATKTFGSRSIYWMVWVHEPWIRAGVNLFVVLTPMGNNPIYANFELWVIPSRVPKSTISIQGVLQKIVNQIRYSYEVIQRLNWSNSIFPFLSTKDDSVLCVNFSFHECPILSKTKSHYFFCLSLFTC